ncbi:hypothetical protein [Arthrobacter pigmenti]
MAEKENSQTWWGRSIIGLAVVLGACFYVLQNPEWGAWTAYAAYGIWAGAAVLFVTIVLVIWHAIRKKRKDRMAAALKPLLGTGWNPQTGFRASRMRRGTPSKVVIDYPDELADYDPAWRAQVEKVVKARMGAEKVSAKWDTAKGRVVLAAKKIPNTVEQQASDERENTRKRIESLLQPAFGVDIDVKVTAWQQEGKEA